MGKEKGGRENAEAEREQALEGGADCTPPPLLSHPHCQQVGKITR